MTGRELRGSEAEKLIDADVDVSHCGRVADRDLVGCTLRGALVASDQPGDWHRVERVSLRKCAQTLITLATTHFADVIVDGLHRAGRSPAYVWSPVFERVTLKGRLNGLKINPEYQGLRLDAKRQAAWSTALQQAYVSVEWALDVTEAQFTSAPTLEAVPGCKVRFDPSRHALVRRSKLQGLDLASLPRRVALQWFLQRSPFDEVVLLTRDEPTYRQQDRDDLMRLRDLGVAE